MPDILKQTVSASQVPALFDESPYVTRWMLYQHFRNSAAIDEDEDELMAWGTRLQPLLLQRVAADHALEVSPITEYVRLAHGPVGATLDGVIVAPDRGRGAVETKCVFNARSWMDRWSGGRAPPRDVELQLQTQMMVGDGVSPYGWGMIAAFHGGEMKYWERAPMLNVQDEIKVRAQALLDDVRDGREPEPFGLPIETPMIAAMFPRTVREDRIVLDSVELAEDARMYEWAQNEVRTHQKVVDQLKPKLLFACADSPGLVLPGVDIFVSRAEIKAATIERKAHVRVTMKVKPQGGTTP